MESRTIRLAEQLLQSVPKDEMDQLVTLLEYYNRFPANDRARAMRVGSNQPRDSFLEEEVITEITGSQKTAGQLSYVTTNSGVCRCCGN